MAHIVNPNSLRYKLAQKILSWIFGYEHMYISIWKHSALSAGGLFIHNNKVLIAKRGGEIEKAGTWYIPGGHIDNEKNESPTQALAREFYEEHKVKIDPKAIDATTPYFSQLVTNHEYILQKDVTLLEQDFVYHLSDSEAANIQTTPEAPEFMFASKKDLEEMHAKGMLLKDLSFMFKLIK